MPGHNRFSVLKTEVKITKPILGAKKVFFEEEAVTLLVTIFQHPVKPHCGRPIITSNKF